jgi:anthranilate phosphoribosyltransferase
MDSLLKQLHSGKELTPAAVADLASFLLNEEAPAERKAELLLALHEKGETPHEVAELVRIFLKLAIKPNLEGRDPERPLVDVCGTGGDRSNFFNVSTAVTILLAAAGADVVKHGNRGITSKAGGADTLEALGIPIQVPPEKTGDFLRKCGLVFLFAPNYHPAFRVVAPVRQLLATQGKHSVFNILGPLLNPASPDFQLTGVFDRSILSIYSSALAELGRKGAWIVHGTLSDGSPLDEVSITGKTFVTTIGCSAIHDPVISPSEFLQPEEMDAAHTEAKLRGGDAIENAAIIEKLLQGQDAGPREHLVAANTAAALCACGLENDLHQAFRRALDLLRSGAGADVLSKARNWRSTET